jgi:hypothetical protein
MKVWINNLKSYEVIVNLGRGEEKDCEEKKEVHELEVVIIRRIK